ncbi:MAG: sugar-transfer associated ATP-grasp domain-containing protein [Pseudomonadota bacterium]
MGIAAKAWRRSADLIALANEIAAVYDISKSQAFGGVADLYFREKFTTVEIGSYCFCAPEVRRRYPLLCSKEKSQPALRRHNRPDAAALSEDKNRFYAFCRAQNIVHPEVYAVAGAGTLDLLATPQGDFIRKDLAGAYGSGFDTYEFRKGAIWSGAGDVHADFAALLDDAKVAATPALFQARLYDHPDLMAASGRRSLQSLRIATYRGEGQPARLLFGYLKMVAGDNVIDNFQKGMTGNFVAVPDQDSGQIIVGRRRRPGSVGIIDIERHPETGQPLKDIRIPLWREAIATCAAAHELMPGLDAIGWDIAVTADGPSILEANAWFDPPQIAPETMSAADWRLIFG